MQSIQSKKSSGNAAPYLEWQTCDHDAEWQIPQQVTLTSTADPPQDTPRPSWVARQWRVGAALLLILTTVGFWAWHTAQRGIAQIEGELGDSVELELWTTATQDAKSVHKHSASTQGDGTHPLTSSVQLLALPGKAAIVQVVTQSTADRLRAVGHQPALRQTRFYQQTAGGWMGTKPNAELWGSPRHLESSHFIFHFRQNDAQVVSAVAPQIDDVYAELLRNFGLTPNAEKLVIDVTVEHATGAMFTPLWDREPLVVPSPAIYLAPVALSDSAILAQSITLPLIEYMGERAIEDHAIPSRWRPLLLGLRLWQLWDLDLSMAHWRQELVSFLYTDVPTFPSGRQYELTEPLTELCAIRSLWTQSPTIVGIPFECRISNEGNWVIIRWLEQGPYSHLDQLNTPLEANEPAFFGDYFFFGPTEVVAMATLIEYIVATYGHERLPVLLANLAHFDDWETLIPAVFGVSAADFDAGWRSYLAQQYNVSLEH